MFHKLLQGNVNKLMVYYHCYKAANGSCVLYLTLGSSSHCLPSNWAHAMFTQILLCWILLAQVTCKCSISCCTCEIMHVLSPLNNAELPGVVALQNWTRIERCRRRVTYANRAFGPWWFDKSGCEWQLVREMQPHPLRRWQGNGVTVTRG